MNTNTNITPFIFGESAIRTTTRSGDPWFVIADVCSALGLTNPTMAMNRLHIDDLSTTEGIDSMGRKQTVNICNESGLYTLIFQSRKAAAKEFTRWVTSEVLPSLRRHGFYGRREQAVLAFLGQLLGMGIAPKDATRLAMASFPALTAEERHSMDRAAGLSLPNLHPLHEHILEGMEQGREYNITQIFTNLPAAAVFPRNLSAAARNARLGATLKEMRDLGLVTYRKDSHRTRLYTRRNAKVVAFSANT